MLARSARLELFQRAEPTLLRDLHARQVPAGEATGTRDYFDWSLDSSTLINFEPHTKQYHKKLTSAKHSRAA